MFDVNTSLIRFWEKEFPVIQPKKNKRGNRLYTTREIMKIDRIYMLVKDQGYTLEGAKKAIREKKKQLVTDDQPEENEIISRLEGIRQKLLSLKSN